MENPRGRIRVARLARDKEIGWAAAPDALEEVIGFGIHVAPDHGRASTRAHYGKAYLPGAPGRERSGPGIGPVQGTVRRNAREFNYMIPRRGVSERELGVRPDG